MQLHRISGILWSWVIISALLDFTLGGVLHRLFWVLSKPFRSIWRLIFNIPPSFFYATGGSNGTGMAAGSEVAQEGRGKKRRSLTYS